MNKNITSYPNINLILSYISNSMREILEKNLVGVYLFGSLSYGDFNPESSDIDLVIIIKNRLTDHENQMINDFHQSMSEYYKTWSDRLECSYVPVDMLNSILPPPEPRPYYNNGTFYEAAPYGNEWIINNYLLYTHSIPLIGSDFKKLIQPIDIIEVQKACIRDLFQEWEPKIIDFNWLDKSINQSYLVMNLCRILYTVLCGNTATKRISAEWVRNKFTSAWDELIITATNWKFGEKMCMRNQAINFIKFTINEIKQTKLYQQMQSDSDFDSALICAMENAHVSGAIMLIIHDGQVNVIKEYGFADPETNRKVTADTLFTIASISKTVTATALMTLYEQGKLGLDDEINQYLPFKIHNPHFPNTPITFRMLLSHTSTIQDSDTLYEYYTLNKIPVLPDSPILLGNYLKDYLCSYGKLYNSENNFLREIPGKNYNYSNTGFGLIGYLIECISGIPFDKYCKKNIFEPLGMKNTAWYFKDVNLNQMAVPYGYDESLHNLIRYDFYSYPTYPDGALKTSGIEFSRFLSIFINEGKTFDGALFLQADTIKEMLTVKHFSGMDQGDSVGLAWHFNGRDYWHDGRDPGISTATYFNPTTRQGFVFFSNGSDFDALNVPNLESIKPSWPYLEIKILDNKKI